MNQEDTAWRKLAEERKWNEIDWRSLPLAQQKELLELLESVVPRKKLKNGIEEAERHLRPNEIKDPQLWQASLILYLGELRFEVEGGEVPQDSSLWKAQETRIEAIIAQALEEDECTEGDRELSRCEHAKRAQEYLSEIKKITGYCLSQAEDPDEAAWIGEALAGVTFNGFFLGARMQAAWHKTLENHTIRGQKTYEAARQGGAMRRGQMSKMTREVLAAMAEEFDKMKDRGERRNVSLAAQWVFKRGLGSSAEANRSLWKRYNAK